MNKINYILKSVLLVGYAGNINVMNRKQRGIPKVSDAREDTRKK
jgi:hypothetical protein